MMTKDQSEIVKIVYKRFIDSEQEHTWSEFDDNMEFIGFLNDRELVKETLAIVDDYRFGIACKHENEANHRCFAPTILEAVEAILELYDEAKHLHKKNAYLLQFYLTMCALRMIRPKSM